MALSHAALSGLERCMRKPQRLTITVPWKLYQQLLACSDREGRSLSNLASYWLERQAEWIAEGLTHGQAPHSEG